MRHPYVSDAEYIERFKSKCTITESGCWEWNGFTHAYRGMKPGQRGYAAASYRGKNWRLPRLMVTLTKRPLVGKEVARHTCDNPPCINPDHLIPGTQKQNIGDVIAKGKQQFHPSHYTHCKHGHDFALHAWVDSRGHRHCKMCARVRGRIKAGWPIDIANSVGTVPAGQRPVAGTWQRTSQNRGA